MHRAPYSLCRRTQIGFSRSGNPNFPISGKPEIGAPVFKFRLPPKRARGTPGSRRSQACADCARQNYRTHGPRHLAMPRHSGSLVPQVRRNPRRPARGVYRLAVRILRGVHDPPLMSPVSAWPLARSYGTAAKETVTELIRRDLAPCAAAPWVYVVAPETRPPHPAPRVVTIAKRPFRGAG
jgi:hypothetical protein